jgi:hypothetical protein
VPSGNITEEYLFDDENVRSERVVEYEHPGLVGSGTWVF